MLGALYPFERFTDAAKETLTTAQQEAEQSQHSYIGTEHLLIALVTQRGTVASETLARLGVTEEHVRARVAAILGQNERIIIQHIIPTSRTKQVIELSFEVARQAGSETVATDHLLLGLLTEGEGVAAHVLVDARATEEAVRAVAAEVREDGISESTGTHRVSVGASAIITRRSSAWMPRVIKGASTEANADLDDEVTDVHLLRHLLRSQDPRVVAALRRAGVDPEALIAALRPPDDVIALRRALRAARQDEREAAARKDYPAAEAARLREVQLREELAAAEAAWLQPEDTP